MRTTRHNPAVRFFWIGVLCLLAESALVLIPRDALAQGCSMCQTVMPHGNDPMARGMFWSVLLLMCAPFVVGTSIGGWLWYQHRRVRRTLHTPTPVFSLPMAYLQKEGQP